MEMVFLILLRMDMIKAADSLIGRDDLVFVDDTGETRAWINNRGSALGLAPEWDSVGLGATSRDGITNSTQVSFGNVWGHKDLNTYPDYNGRGADCKTILL